MNMWLLINCNKLVCANRVLCKQRQRKRIEGNTHLYSPLNRSLTNGLNCVVCSSSKSYIERDWPDIKRGSAVLLDNPLMCWHHLQRNINPREQFLLHAKRWAEINILGLLVSSQVWYKGWRVERGWQQRDISCFQMNQTTLKLTPNWRAVTTSILHRKKA
jgi:hypothetical protein